MQKLSVQLKKIQRSALVNNFSWTLAGNVVYAACQWGILIVLARIASPEIVGKFGLGLAFSAPIMIFSSLKLRSVLVTDARREYDFFEYVLLRIFTTLLGLAFVIGFASWSNYERSTQLVIIWIGLAKGFDLLSDIFHGFIQKEEKMKFIAIARFLQGFSQIGVLSTIYYFSQNLILATLGYALVSGLITLIYDIPVVISMVKQSIKLRVIVSRFKSVQGRRLFELARQSLPLGIAITLSSLTVNIPRYFIANSTGEASLGIFVSLASLLVAGSIIINALGVSATPRLSKTYATNQLSSFDRLIGRLVLMGALLGICGIILAIFAGEFLLMFIFQPEYGQYANLLILLTVIATLQFSYVFLGTGIQSMRVFNAHLPIQVISLVILIGACYYLIPSFGLMGAAYGMLCAVVGEFVGFSIVFALIRYKPFQAVPA